MIGGPDSWDHVVSISNQDHKYRFCIWSPCGQFVAAQTAGVVEIRDQLTFELLTTLQLTETSHPLTGPLAYSPDGRSLACGSDTFTVIWDIQTGGAAKEIGCGFKSISMVWSLDGGAIGFIDSQKSVHIYDLTSGTTISPGNLSSTTSPCLLAQEKTFRIFTTVRGDRTVTVEALEVGHTLAKIKSWIVMCHISLRPPLNVSYSPATSHCAISADRSLYSFGDSHSFTRLLEGESISCHCFSPNGGLFAAVTGERIRVWKFTGSFYCRWKGLWCPGQTDSSLRFSPTQSSILGSFGNLLHLWRLDDLPATPETGRRQYAGLSRSGNYIATAYQFGMTITITDLHSQAPSQLIYTDVEIRGLALTGNVLLAFGVRTVVAWLLTEEGLVDGVLGGRKADRSDSIWAASALYFDPTPEFKVEGHLGMIAPDGEDFPPYSIYHIETGETFQPDQAPQCFRPTNPWKSSDGIYPGQVYLGFHNLSPHSAPPEGDRQTSRIVVQEGWAKDPEGRHRLWVPVEWRADWDLRDWRHDVAVQFGIFGGRIAIIKF